MTFGIWITFVLACLLFSISPGAGAVASVSSSLAGGWNKVRPIILGLQLALVIHLVLVSAGLGALLASSAAAFAVMKYIGAAYLIYLGVSKWREPGEIAGLEVRRAHSQKRLIREGMFVNLMNPKSIIFLAAFLPQFLNTSSDLISQYIVLGVTVLTIDTLVMLTYAGIASRARCYLRNPGFVKTQSRIFGTFFIGTGIALARAEQ